MSRAWEAETLEREHKTLKKTSFFFFPWLCLQSSSPLNPCFFPKRRIFGSVKCILQGSKMSGDREEVRGRETLQMLFDLICVLPFCPITRNQLASFLFLFPIWCRAFFKKKQQQLSINITVMGFVNDFLGNIFLNLSKDNSLGSSPFLLPC